MLDRLTVSDFVEHVHETFRTALDSGEALDLELIEAKPFGAGRPGGRPPFSLIFRGPRQVALEQRIYTLEHEAIGTLDIFLVPIGPEGDLEGTHYQALFN